MNLSYLLKYFLLGIPLFAPPLSGEIIEVSVNWNGGTCSPKCSEMLSQQFQKLHNTKEITINPQAARAVLKWKPEAPFSYHMIKTPMQMVGVGLNEIRVRVRGKAHMQGKAVALISTGDGTFFLLISPFTPQPNSYTSYANPIFYNLSPTLREEVIKAAKENKTLVIEGPLYQPQRAPPLYLTVEKIQVEKK